MEILAQAEDAELMRLAGDGSEPAFEELVRRYQDPIYSYFRHCGAGRTDADDLAQETFIKLYRSASSYQPSARFTTFLYTIARNTWIDFTRRSHRRAGTVELSDEVLAAVEAPAQKLPEEEGEYSPEVMRHFQQALEGLPDKLRQTLMLSEAQGLRYAEIAEILEVPVGTIKSRIFNAVNALRESLRKRGVHS